MPQLVELLASAAWERSTLDELAQMLKDRGRWPKARGLFDRIRQKCLKAHQEKIAALVAQYAFEEVCAKTLYNLTLLPAAYDADAPYWIVPNAIAAARHLGIKDSQVLEIVVR